MVQLHLQPMKSLVTTISRKLFYNPVILVYSLHSIQCVILVHHFHFEWLKQLAIQLFVSVKVRSLRKPTFLLSYRSRERFGACFVQIRRQSMALEMFYNSTFGCQGDRITTNYERVQLDPKDLK